MYSELKDHEKTEILKMSGAEVFARSGKALEEGKISNEKRMQMCAFWLNQHGKKSPRNNRTSWEKYERSELEESAHKIFN